MHRGTPTARGPRLAARVGYHMGKGLATTFTWADCRDFWERLYSVTDSLPWPSPQRKLGSSFWVPLRKLDPGFRRDDGIMEPYSAAAFFWPSSFMAVPKRACA